MGIIIHAGMAKSGSSAIQGFLQREQQRLQAHEVQVVRAHLADGKVEVLPLGDGTVNSGDLVPALRDPVSGSEATAELVEGLSDHAARHGTVVLSGEAFEQVFWRPDGDVLDSLSDLAASHPVRVAYYVRPQHTALEAAWRQWGFRSGQPPSTYLRNRALGGNRYHYLQTIERMRTQAPGIDFVVRPFRRDVLAGGDVVTDFLTHFLPTVGDTSHVSRADNVGLALDLVNVLQVPAASQLWDSPHHNWVFNRVKQILEDVDAEVSQAALEGRTLLQAWCHQRFETSNLAMIRAEGWLAAEWVPAPTMVDADPQLEDIDTLWAVPAAPQVTSALVHLLHELVGAGPRRAPRSGTRPRGGRAASGDEPAEMRPMRVTEEDHRRLVEEHDRLVRRRSVRTALKLASLAAPVFRWARRRRG